MTDFAVARRMMVDGQVRPADVTDLRLLAAFQDVPRETFVPASMSGLAYLDLDVPAGEGGARRLLKPMVLGKLLQAAEISGTDKILDVGCASGYSTAILSNVAGEIVALEEDAAVARRASDALRGVRQITVVTGELTAGWPARAPYDVILVNGAVESVPEALLAQLKEGGRLVCILGSGPAGKATLYRRTGSEVGSRALFDANAPLLAGFAKPPVFAF
ncbi:MAG: protein-L-isoaspartate O-methyltransferase [Pseudolabrys sp.]|nr:protein-L-isoaspartate O-methyltransferase [Pseudolabrys sp.]